ncbi:MAG TPA: metallophosphoesterase family protein [Verrucomicrobiae bacterium]|jgi:predicted phosphodiesterase|nr:metallophosphoesterase family protein [Verrucomicrobiae bacterium]
MRLLVLSDVHANLEALEASLKAAPAYDVMANLGDVVGYNASPNEVCDRIREMNVPVVRGNHDRACSGLSNLAEFNLVAAMSARWTQMKLTPENTEWLRNLPEGPLRHDHVQGVEFVHGSPRDEDEYVLNVPTAALDFHLPGHSDVIFFGHTHLQGGFAYNVSDGRTRPLLPKYSNDDEIATWKIELDPGERYLINPGSVGQPRDNDWRGAFAFYEKKGDGLATVTFYRVPYDVEQTQERILSANLPERLATRLALGR